jgi:hypothetical protein
MFAGMFLPDPQANEHPPATTVDNWVIGDAPTSALYQAIGQTVVSLVGIGFGLWTLGKVAEFFTKD